MTCPNAAGVQEMYLKMPLEQPVFDAIIHHAYMLHDDEREVLLRAFLEMSYKIHREAVEIMSPEEDIGSLLAAHMQFEKEPVTESSSVTAAKAPGEITAVRNSHESAIAKHLQSFCHRIRRTESVLQEEEEIALFSTIQGVADQVNREALEMEIMGELKGDARFAAAYERGRPGPWGSMVVSKGEEKGVKAAGGSKRVRRPGWPFDTYIECMDEELLITRGMIEKNRAESQEYLNKAHAM